MCFPVNFVKFPRTPFLQNTSAGCFLILQNNRKREIDGGEKNPPPALDKIYLQDRYLQKKIDCIVGKAIDCI